MIKRPQYPDISDILAKKARGRSERGSLTFSQKLAALDNLREGASAFTHGTRRRIFDDAALARKPIKKP